MVKGATKFDQLCHAVFTARKNSYEYLSRKTGVRCSCCGHELDAYYCEERLYLVECPNCEVKALVAAKSPREAAYKTFGRTVLQNGWEGGI